METFPCYWPFVRGILRWPVNSPHKSQWRGALMFLLNCAWINGCANSRQAGDLRRHRVHYDVIVMQKYRLWWYNRMSGMEYAKFADFKRQPNCHRSDDRTLWKYVKSYQGTSITIVFVSLYLKCHLWHCTPSKHRILSGVLIFETQGMQ